VLEKTNDGSEDINVGLKRSSVGEESGDGVGDAQAVDGSFAFFVHVVEQSIARNKI
jgi:hypothetical protein